MKPPQIPYLLKLAMVAVAYPAMGLIGLALTQPAHFEISIWPQAGLAIALLILWGMKPWPGIFIGSIFLSFGIGVSSGMTADLWRLFTSIPFAVGPTLQAVAAAWITRKLFGNPLRFGSFIDIGLLLLICGPLICAIAPTLGFAWIMAKNGVTAAEVPLSWSGWWFGQVLGVIVFLPIGLIGPWRPWTLTLKGSPATGFTRLTVSILALSLCLTFVASGITERTAVERNEKAFESLVNDHQFALRQRLESYEQILDAAVGLFKSSDEVTPEEWETFIQQVTKNTALEQSYDIGVIKRVPENSPARQFSIGNYHLSHVWGRDSWSTPLTTEYFSVSRSEPSDWTPNPEWQAGRNGAALHARDTGSSAISRQLGQNTPEPGFLIFTPLYAGGAVSLTVAQRQEAFEGWVYIQVTGQALMTSLTKSQGVSLDFSVYEGPEAQPARLIYTTISNVPRSEEFRIEKTLPVMERSWTIIWRSTPDFHSVISAHEGIYVLTGGLLLTFLLSLFLLALDRRQEAIRQMVERKTREVLAVEQENRSIIETAVVGIVVLDRAGQILRYNQAVNRLAGGPSTDAELQSFLEQLNLLDRQDGGTDHEVRSVHWRGETMHLTVQLNSWTGENDEPRYTAIIRDITGEIQAKRTLEETEERWKMALEGANLGVFDIDLPNGTSTVSETWKTMLGFAPDAQIDPQAEWLDRVHPDDLPKVQEEDRACMAQEKARSVMEYRIRRADGRWIWLRSDAVITAYDRDGRPLRMVGTQTDVTELKNAVTALQANEQKFRNAIEDAPVGMALVTPGREWIKVNAALCTLLGYSEQELLGLDVSDFVNAADLASLNDGKLEQVLRGEISTYQRELRVYHRDGRLLWVLISVSLGRDHEGSDHLIVIFQDITEQKEMERLKSEFVASVSHELRTPLTSIRGSLGLIIGSLSHELSDGVERLLTIAHANSERLVHLVNDILDLEKMSSGKMSFDIEEESLGILIRDAVEANQGFADQLGIEQDLDGTPFDVRVEVDSNRFHQVLANLLSNAVKFSPEGGTVRVFGEMRGGNIRIYVKDDGPGIAPQFRSRIFSRFAQADSSATRKANGTGLGLHLAKMMVEEMGGRIGFESDYGDGSTFWIELPVTNAAGENASGPEKSFG
ncbi:PAS domain S-box protein [Notoacmeibacter ruber]|uniref:histidine kinase n=1 Tax=Notoacmeibacter ruber TaxID=2670375 RepID=A0A3L7JFI9_9HYPH|nr:PAS domain S-box protein [Notoacmeibacter ruber]RLQ87222.1 PAS domain S-box protein [Notoacmeibacter ruber]